MGTLQSCMEPSPWVLLAAKLRKKGQTLLRVPPCSLIQKQNPRALLKQHKMVNLKIPSQSMSVLWEYTVTKALGHRPESGRIYDMAFDKAKTSGEERPETLVVSVGLGDCSLE